MRFKDKVVLLTGGNRYRASDLSRFCSRGSKSRVCGSRRRESGQYGGNAGRDRG